MNKLYITLISFFISSFVFAQDNNHFPGNMMVMLDSEESARQLEKDLSIIDGVATKLKIERTLSASMHVYLFSFDFGSIHEEKMLATTKKYQKVKIVQYNHYLNERYTIPNDTMFSSLWNMNNDGTIGGSVADADIDAPEAWDITTGGLTTDGDTIVVAVIDGGFSLTHPDLNFWKNYTEIPNNSIDDDGNGYVDDVDGWNSSSGTDNFSTLAHGTHVSGTVGARGNNCIGVSGVNWNVKVMPISYGSLSEANVVAAYSYVRNQRRLYNQTNGTKGAFVVATNSSFGVDLAMPAAYPLWCAMYDSLGAVGILSAGATANANYNVDVQGDIPTSCTSDWLITVTNTQNNDTKYPSAGYGTTSIDLGAPGTNITSTYYNGSNTYSQLSGTSMASPHVAGTIALLYSAACPLFIANYKADPAGIALMVKDSILGAADSIASLSGITVTGGRLNLYKSVKSIMNYCSLPTVVDSIRNYCNSIGINELNEAEHTFEISNIYPNPAKQNITVVMNTFESADIILTNVLGQEVKRIHNENNIQGKQMLKIDISNLSKGVYFVGLSNMNKSSKMVKVVVY